MAGDKDDLWRNFPKTAIEFDRRFAMEEACRAYWIEARWGGEPACARCGSKRVWAERGGFLFECGDCDHQTSLTSGTLLEKTRKPFKVWFRAVFVQRHATWTPNRRPILTPLSREPISC